MPGDATGQDLAGLALAIVLGEALDGNYRALSRADNISDAYFSRVSGQHISATRSPSAFQQARFEELVENLLQIPLGDLLASGNVLDLGGLATSVVSDIEKRSNPISACCSNTHLVSSKKTIRM